MIIVVMGADPCGNADFPALFGICQILKAAHKLVAGLPCRLFYLAAVDYYNRVVAQSQHIEHSAVAAVIANH